MILIFQFVIQTPTSSSYSRVISGDGSCSCTDQEPSDETSDSLQTVIQMDSSSAQVSVSVLSLKYLHMHIAYHLFDLDLFGFG